MKNPNDIQEGGTHYKNMKIQPWEVMEAWGPETHFIGFLRFCVLKRLGRWDSKDSALTDAKKARHELDKLISIMEKEVAPVNIDFGEPLVYADCFNQWSRELQLERGCNVCPMTLECQPAKR